MVKYPAVFLVKCIQVISITLKKKNDLIGKFLPGLHVASGMVFLEITIDIRGHCSLLSESVNAVWQADSALQTK